MNQTQTSRPVTFASGPQLAAARTVSDKSRQEAATFAGISIATLKRAEEGTTELRWSAVILLAELYSCDPLDLVREAEPDEELAA